MDYRSNPNETMTIDEAIQHCIEKSKGCDTCCIYTRTIMSRWLQELKDLRMVTSILRNVLNFSEQRLYSDTLP